MKKILALAALLAVAPAFAAHNEFTFNVNSSGPNIHVCGFHLGTPHESFHEGHKTGDAIATTANYVTWEEVTYDEWTGEEISRVPHNSINEGYHKIPDWIEPEDYEYMREIGTNVFVDVSDTYNPNASSQFTTIENLKFFLSTEYYGANYGVNVCYHLPLYLDHKDFELTAAVQYDQMKFANSYVQKANLDSFISVNSYLLRGNHWVGQPWIFTDFVRFNMQSGNAQVVRPVHYKAGPSDSRMLKINYNFLEQNHPLVKRPHVAHGGQFTLLTDVIPVNNPASN